jgi:DNA mismatch repair protein MutS2
MTNNQDESLFFAAEMGADVPELDLHGLSRREAEYDLDQFIDRQFAAGEKVLRVVHGRGTGTLRRFIHGFLSNHDQVKDYKNASQPHQIGGVTLVRLDI